MSLKGLRQPLSAIIAASRASARTGLLRPLDLSRSLSCYLPQAPHHAKSRCNERRMHAELATKHPPEGTHERSASDMWEGAPAGTDHAQGGGTLAPSSLARGCAPLHRKANLEREAWAIASPCTMQLLQSEIARCSTFNLNA